MLCHHRHVTPSTETTAKRLSCQRPTAHPGQRFVATELPKCIGLTPPGSRADIGGRRVRCLLGRPTVPSRPAVAYRAPANSCRLSPVCHGASVCRTLRLSWILVKNIRKYSESLRYFIYNGINSKLYICKKIGIWTPATARSRDIFYYKTNTTTTRPKGS